MTHLSTAVHKAVGDKLCERLACAQRSYFLDAGLNYLGAARAERAGDPPVSDRLISIPVSL